jgi:YHS domain-containing protein
MWTQHVVYRRDPMCGTHLEADEVAATYTYIGRDYSFCSLECHEMFVRAPDKYLAILAHEPDGHCGYRRPLPVGVQPSLVGG